MPASPPQVIETQAKAAVPEAVPEYVQSHSNEHSQGDQPEVRRFEPESPTAKKHRDLAQALFGHQEDDPTPPVKEDTSLRNVYHQPSPSTPVLMDRSPTHTRSATDRPIIQRTPSSRLPSRNASLLNGPHGGGAQLDLVREVQRKTEEATASLKRGPSVRVADASASNASLVRKRIAPHQISAPHLVSASTSVDTIPLRSPSVASGTLPQQKQPVKLGQRIKRWGTLRGRPTLPNGDEVTPFPLDAQSASAGPVRSPVTISNANTPEPPASASILESGTSKERVITPPATAGPGFKGFISRFRKPRPQDAPETERRSMDQTRRERPQISPPASSIKSAPLQEFTFPKADPSNHIQSAPASKPTFNSLSSRRVAAPDPPPASTLVRNGAGPPDDSGQSLPPQQRESSSLALRQLFDAASNLGLDQLALNELIARSPSTSTRSTTGWTMPTRNNSTANSSPPTRNDSALSRARSPAVSDIGTDGGDDTIVRNVIPRKRAPNRLNTGDQNLDPSSSAILRRTIIFASDSRASNIDLNALVRKNSQSARRRRSASATSVSSSSRSVHDRAPTPPPPRSPVGRRFSRENSPPVPQLPTSFSAQAESLLPVPQPRRVTASPMEKSSSAYDSLYDPLSP